MSETISIIGKKTVDADGDFHTVGGGFSIEGCVITPQGKIDTYEEDIIGGNILEMQITYPAGYPPIDDGTLVEIRGTQYKAKYPSWDFSPGRNQWLSLHQPKQVLIVEKVEA